MSDPDRFRELVDEGIDAHRRGDAESAARAYRMAVELRPDDAEANSLLGLALLHTGQPDQAGALLRKAVLSEPDQPGLRLNLVECLERQRAYDEARQHVEQILETDPAHARAWEKRGDLARRSGGLDDAADAYLRALAIRPGLALGAKLARTLVAARRYDEAEKLLQQLTDARPGDATLLDLQAESLVAQRRWTELESFAQRWTRDHPEQAPGWRRLSQSVYEQARFRDAMRYYRKVIELEGEDATRLVTYSRICLQALDLDAAAEKLDRAEALDPELPDLLAAKGLLLTYRGDFAAAEQYCRRCLALAPDQIPVYTQLSRLTGGRLDDSQMQWLTDYANDRQRPAENRITARYAVAHCYDQRGDIDEAFAAYAIANREQLALSRVQGLAYDPQQRVRRTDELIRRCGSVGPRLRAAAAGAQPIFIVGMPRSGTTLVESMLAAHSTVRAGGERPQMAQILEACLAAGTTPAADQLSQWADYYLGELPAAEGAAFVTDKNPLNFESAGLIARLFPNAPVIHIRRNPLETCLSIFRHEFTKFWTFAHRLEDLGHFYGQYLRLVSHWQATLGDRFITVDYEQFVTRFDRLAPELVAHCGLGWEPGCADFGRRVPAIATFSAVQAREPLSLRQGKAQRYAHHLEPLSDALRRAGVDPRAGLTAAL